MQAKYSIFAAVTTFVIALDQATKIWIVNNIDYRTGHIDIIDGFFQIVHVQNKGAAFGMGSGTTHAITFFLIFTVIAVAVILSMLVKLHPRERFMSAVMALIMGGAIGNAIDRADKASVTDFLRFYTDHPKLAPWLAETLGTTEYPSFNVADMAIVGGVIFFIAHQIFIGDPMEVEDVGELPDAASGD